MKFKKREGSIFTQLIYDKDMAEFLIISDKPAATNEAPVIVRSEQESSAQG